MSHQLSLPPAPEPGRLHRDTQANIHVRVLEQDISLDKQFLRKPPAQSPADQLSHLVEDIVAHSNGIEGNVSRYDQSGPTGRGQQCVFTVHAQGLDPRLHTLNVPCFMGLQDRRLEGVQRQCQNSGSGVVFAPLLGHARINAIVTFAIHHLAILHHSALWKNDHLTTPKDFFGQKRKKPGMVIGYRSHAQQIVGKCRSFDEEILRGHRAALGPGFLVNQVLGEEGLEAGKVVEEKNVSRVNLALMVQLEIDSQNLLQNREDSYRPLISGRVDLKSIILVHFTMWPDSFGIEPEAPGGGIAPPLPSEETPEQPNGEAFRRVQMGLIERPIRQHSGNTQGASEGAVLIYPPLVKKDWF